MRYSKIIKPIIFIAIFLFVINVVESFFSNNTMEGIELEKENTIDYLVIGDSEAYTSILPMEIWNQYGFTGYNLGVSAQRLQDTYYSLRKTLKTQSPKVVLFETNTIFSVLDFDNEKDRVLKSFLQEHSRIYKYHNDLKKLSFDNANGTINQKQSSDVFKGAKFNKDVKAYEGGDYINETGEVQEISKIQIYFLNKIIKLCEDKEIKLIWYSSLTPRNWKREKHNAVEAFADEHNIEFIDLNLIDGQLGVDWSSDTYDKGDHINFEGAKKVTGFIGEYLSKNSDLVDHRQDNRYEAWKDNWEEYLKKIN